MSNSTLNLNPPSAVNYFTKRNIKVHELEYLVRNKERQIEILRGELAESR